MGQFFKRIVKTLFLLSLLGLLQGVFAANIYSREGYICLDGRIEVGDAERFALTLARQSKISTLYIDSIGGNVAEAIKLSKLVEAAHLGVTVRPDGGFCVSACFFVFLSGHERASHYASEGGVLPPEEFRKKLSFVGIHRPYFLNPENNSSSINFQADLMRQISDYLDKKRIPRYLVDEMMSRPSNEVYWLTQKDLNMLGEYSPAFEEVAVSKCNYLRPSNPRWNLDDFKKSYNCIFQLWIDEYAPRQSKVFSRLKVGWRPY